MGFWKMGVGLPLSNHSFNHGTRIYATILSTSTAIGAGSHEYSATENTGDDAGLILITSISG